MSFLCNPWRFKRLEKKHLFSSEVAAYAGTAGAPAHCRTVCCLAKKKRRRQWCLEMPKRNYAFVEKK